MDALSNNVARGGGAEDRLLAALHRGRGGGGGRWRRERRVVALGEQNQVLEIDPAVGVEVSGGEGLAAGVVVLGEGDEVVEIDGSIAVGVAGEYEEVERVVARQGIARTIGDAAGGERGAVISVVQQC